MSIIQFKRGTTAPTGLILGEPAWDYANNKFYIGVTSSAILINPSVVTFINGLSGGVTLAAGSNITLTPSDNIITIASTASGGGGAGTKTYNRFTPLDNMAPGISFATLDTRGPTGNSIPVLEFDGTNLDEYAIFGSVIPEAAVLTNGLGIYLHWMGDTATSGNVLWGTQFMGMTADLDNENWQTAVEATGSVNATSGIPTLTTITNTNLGGITGGNLYRLRVYRKASDTINDTMVGDAQLIAVEVRGI